MELGYNNTPHFNMGVSDVTKGAPGAIRGVRDGCKQHSHLIVSSCGGLMSFCSWDFDSNDFFINYC